MAAMSASPAPFPVTKLALRTFLLAKTDLSPHSVPGSASVSVHGSASVPGSASGRTPAPTAADVLDVVRKLECVQIDPVAAVERNQHLVLSARIPRYQPDLLNGLLASGDVFEFMANALCAIPMADYPVFTYARTRLRERLASELDTYRTEAKEILARLEHEGPLPAKAFETRQRVHGYWDNQAPKTKVTSHVLNLLTDSAIVRVVERQGNIRLFDLTERSIPQQLQEASSKLSMEESRRLMLEKYMRAYRVFDVRDSRFGWQYDKVAERKERLEPYLEQGIVIPLGVQDVKTEYYILAEDLPLLEDIAQEVEQPSRDASGRTGTRTSGSRSQNYVRFLPPLDNLLWRRPRLVDLFDFDYKWEIYTPAHLRQYGYYAMPILYGTELVGRVDPLLDRKNNKLVIENLQVEPRIRITKRFSRAVWAEMQRFAKFHGAKEIEIVRTCPEGIAVGPE